MIEFIKKNKLFLSSLSILLIIIGGLSLKLVSQNSPTKDPIDPDDIIIQDPDKQEPDEQEPPLVMHEKATVNQFSGVFNDNTNTISLSWSISSHDSEIEKIELYNKDTFISDVTDNSTYIVPIDLYSITTGSNIFRLHLTLKNEEPVYAEANVQVDYIFDVEKFHSFVDNNLGKGVLLSIRYTYNSLTPVGAPGIMITKGKIPGKVTYIGTFDKNHGNGYVTSTTTYFVPVGDLESIDWHCQYSFASVNLTYDYTLQEDLTQIDFVQDRVEIEDGTHTEEKEPDSLQQEEETTE